MSDLNREQFEKYAKSKGWEDRHLKQRDDGGYEDWGVHPIWLSWQASRECLVIELPKPAGLDRMSSEMSIQEIREDNRFNRALELAKKALTAAGVKYK